MNFHNVKLPASALRTAATGHDRPGICWRDGYNGGVLLQKEPAIVGRMNDLGLTLLPQ